MGKIESEYAVIPKAIIIQNGDDQCGVKSIELSLGINGDGDDFDTLAVIDEIQNNLTKSEQEFTVENERMNKVKLLLNEYKFLKLKVVSNWDGDENQFYSFSLWGVQLVSNE